MGWIEDYKATVRDVPPLVMPPRFAEACVSDIPKGDIHDVAQDYCRRFYELAPVGRAPVFFGRSREFKSFAAAAIAREVHRAHFEVAWCSCATDVLRVEMDKWSPASRGYMRKLSEVPFLVMDDFWEIGGDGFGRALLVAVAAARYDALKPTIWTANLDVPEGKEWSSLATRYGVSFARRLKDGGREMTVVVTAPF